MRNSNIYDDRTDSAWVSSIWKKGSVKFYKSPEELLRDQLRSWDVKLLAVVAGFRVTENEHTLELNRNACLDCGASTSSGLRARCTDPQGFINRSVLKIQKGEIWTEGGKAFKDSLIRSCQIGQIQSVATGFNQSKTSGAVRI